MTITINDSQIESLAGKMADAANKAFLAEIATGIDDKERSRIYHGYASEVRKLKSVLDIISPDLAYVVKCRAKELLSAIFDENRQVSPEDYEDADGDYLEELV